MKKEIVIIGIMLSIFSSNFGGDNMLKKPAFRPLPLGTVKPAGWLKNQLQIQAKGLSGSLDLFWPDIMNSGWFGGQAEDWERAPYWLDGIIPLAYLLDDQELISRTTRYMDLIIKGQKENGWLGPKKDPATYDLWAIFLVLKPLMQYHEASGDGRVTAVIENTLKWIDYHIGRRPLFNWAKFRWFESLFAIYWLYEQTGENWLMDLAVKLHAQGFNWLGFFQRWPLKNPTPKGYWNYMGHVVNNAMAIKSPALWWRMSGSPVDRAMTSTMIDLLDSYHGMVTGVFTGDECLAGKNPSQGTELCAVVEYLYSLEVALQILGDPSLGDRLEKIAYNALPATFSSHMWAHQYDQQVNQVECSIKENRNWTTNGPESNIYGLEPNYGCCTANFSQGWPKFAAHLWMKSSDNGLVAAAYAPCRISTKVKGVQTDIQVQTDYPFGDRINISISVEKAVEFPIYLRIPAWTTGAALFRKGEKRMDLPPGSFFKLYKKWQNTSRINLVFPMTPKLVPRYKGAVTLERGPLVYALKIGERWQQVNKDKPHRQLPHADWEVYPTTPWNVAIDIQPADLNKLKFTLHPIGSLPFSPQGAPVQVKVKGALLEQWRLKNGSAGPMPKGPVKPKGKLNTFTLIPYGCTNLRITEFPLLKVD